MGRNAQFKSAMSFLESLYYQGIKLGLENTSRMLECVNNPHRDIKFIHVAGTNGKGSICCMLASALAHSGLETGLYTSPHLVSIRERFRVNGKAISETEFTEHVFFLKEQIDHLFSKLDGQSPTFFEFITVLAFLYFHEKKVDIAVIEVGMGGRLDSTNVITPLLSIITEIDYDHTKPLGNDLKKIAGEKAGIIKMGVPVVCGDRKNEVKDVITSCSADKGSPIYLMGRDFDVLSCCYQKKRNSFVQCNRVRWRESTAEISTSLLGEHQCHNTAIAYAALMVLRQNGFSFRSEKVIEGIENSVWPGRLEILPDGIIVDTAHNARAINVLTSALSQLYPGTKWNVMFGVLRDKNWQTMLETLRAIACRFYLVQITNRRAESPDNISSYISDHWTNLPVEICPNVAAGLDKLGEDKNGLIVGSSYLIGEVLSIYCAKSNVNVLDI